MNYKIVLVLFALLLGITCTANAIPVLHILDVQSTTEAQITAVDRTTGETTYYSDPSDLVLYYHDVWLDMPEQWIAAHAQPLFSNGHFSTSRNHYDQTTHLGCPYGGRVNISSELNLHFTVDGSGATLGAMADLSDTRGELQFSLVDETAGTSLFYSNGPRSNNFSTGDLSFVDGHTYQLHALCEIEHGEGDGGDSAFFWCCNSSFATCVRVPSGSTALLASSGLFLLFGYIRLSKQNHKGK